MSTPPSTPPPPPPAGQPPSPGVPDTPETGTPRPWYRRWGPVASVILGVLLLANLCSSPEAAEQDDEPDDEDVAAEPDEPDEPDEPVVPYLIGLSLDDARAAVELAGLELEEHDASGEDRNVFSPGNWTVQSQDPEGGEGSSDGASVRVEIVNVSDRDDDDDDDDDAPDDETEDPAEEPDDGPDETSEDDTDDAPEEPSDEDTSDEDEDASEEDAPDDVDGSSDRDIDAEIGAGPSGLTIVASDTWSDCRVDVNSGIIRRGHTARIDELPADTEVRVPYADLTDSSGERFDYSSTRPESVQIDCSDGPAGQTGFGYWEW